MGFVELERELVSERDRLEARRVPAGVSTAPGRIRVAGVRSKIVTPRRRTAAARPLASRAGWMAAQCGV